MGIETSSLLCSIAWWESGKVLLEYNVEQKNRHAQLLPDLAEKGFKYLGIEKSAVNFVAVASGPGSFTGLRIGMAYAKGFCYALDRKLVTVSNFELMTASVINQKGPICALLDAGRGKLYRAILSKKNNDKFHTDITTWPHLLEQMTKNMIIVKYDTLIIPEEIKIRIPILNVRVTGANVCLIGSLKSSFGFQENIDEIEPFYLQKFAGMA